MYRHSRQQSLEQGSSTAMMNNSKSITYTIITTILILLFTIGYVTGHNVSKDKSIEKRESVADLLNRIP